MGEMRSTLPAELPPPGDAGASPVSQGRFGVLAATSPCVTRVPCKLHGDAGTTWEPCTLTLLK